MKVKESLSIDGVVVTRVGALHNTIVYEDADREEKSLYITSTKGEVFGKIIVSTDMCQGSGYVSDVKVDMLNRQEGT